ncbi:MAG TPA: N-6 DNA methylase [Caulobacteraceae bacterium]|jgi:type I restriction enzyme M protein|nr:N-6 DNA methylase [Caulobacteraceae bacterium]
MANGELTRGRVTTQDIVQRLWGLCNVLRDDGITYQDYVTELTFLLFLKMMQETEREAKLPAAYRWGQIAGREGVDQLDHYRRALLDLGKAPDATVQAIFTDAQTKLRKPANLKTLTTAIDALDWFSAREEGLGELYEGLLEKNANEKKSGAGQYFTPRPLIDCIVRLTRPQPGEVVQDPAAGTGGFLVAADRYIKDHTDDLYALPAAQSFFQRHNAFTGIELVPETHRLALMNLMLHGIESPITLGDSLSPDGEAIGKADLILTNPPFGTKKGGGRPSRQDFSITADTSNKQLAFVEHVVRALKPGGRAAVVVPDNVLFEDNVGRRLRQWLMELCDLHTLLRLPTGIFYSQGVKTNVLFLTRGASDRANTKAVWVYDLRANAPAFGKTRPLTVADFTGFEAAFGDDPLGHAARVDLGAEGRFRRFSREDIAARNDNLDLAWLRDDSAEHEDGLSDPHDLLAAILGHLRAALVEVKAVDAELAGDEVVFEDEVDA